jgi:hypothetical protein
MSPVARRQARPTGYRTFDALGAHARDELGIFAALSTRPIQAALASAGSFVVGAALPLVVTAISMGDCSDPPLSLALQWLFLAPLGGRVRWRRRLDAGRNARHVLGRSRHGGDRRCRGAVRNRDSRGLTIAKSSAPGPACQSNACRR